MNYNKTIFLPVLLALALGACGNFQNATRSPVDALRIGDSRTIVLIHGLYLTPRSWDHWKKFFQGRGYTVHAPAYPRFDQDPAAMRAAHPDPAVAALSMKDSKASLRAFIEDLPEKPILIGHSMGGLHAQIFLSEGLAAGAVVLDSAPPYGIVSPLTAARHGLDFMRANWPIVSPFAGDDEPILLSEEEFAWAFTNRVPRAEQREIYDEHYVPASRRLARDALNADIARVDFDRPRGPLLLISGAEDRIIPPSITRLNYAEYDESAGLTEYKEFAGRGHYIAGQAGWEEVAEFTLAWIDHNR
ncbi:MAG: alpha/beta fold hydrolase [Leptospirales bacterium]|jgi:pimeloyl-ACP methyl ester carboxylesterase